MFGSKKEKGRGEKINEFVAISRLSIGRYESIVTMEVFVEQYYTMKITM